MKTFIIYTEPFTNNNSKKKANRALKSAKKHGIEAQLYKSVYFKDNDKAMKELGIFSKYKGVRGRKTDFNKMTCPETRIANGITHYKLYRWAVQMDEAVCILEHDAEIVAPLPDPYYNSIIQVSSHKKEQMTPKLLAQCGRARKMEKYDPKAYKNIDMTWGNKKGTIKHPLNGTNGTSGYIVGPGAAAKLIHYIETEGVGFADRVRLEHIQPEGKLFLQVPQSVICHGDIKSTQLR